jgi:MOSC domain-containing protein YiiM
VLNPGSSLAKLFDAPMRPGRVGWIGRRPARREPVLALEDAQLEAGRGLVGDRYSRLGGARQVTLIQQESLQAIAAHLGLESVSPESLRRNIVTAGINLLALKERRFRVGPAVLEVSGECHPCSRMEEILGVGGYNAVRGLGGVTARVLTSGEIRLGDAVARSDDLTGSLL